MAQHNKAASDNSASVFFLKWEDGMCVVRRRDDPAWRAGFGSQSDAARYLNERMKEEARAD
jgi:hypothetical protein